MVTPGVVAAMNDPTAFYNIPLTGLPGNYGTWQETPDYYCWSGSFARTDKPLTIWEIVEGGVVKIPQKPAMLHIIPAGRPHHIDHLFGYWHTCNADKFIVRKEQQDSVHYMIVLGGAKRDYSYDVVAWYCASCGTELGGGERVEAGARNRPKFLDEQIRLVRRFNDDESLRHCTKCGAIHPRAYGLLPEVDTPLERDLRTVW